jgi:hypothetical protein
MAYRRSYGRNAPPDPGDERDIRDPLGHAFLRMLTADFKREGNNLIVMLRMKRPFDYLKLVVAFLPKKFQGRDPVLAEMSDEEYWKVLTAIRAAVAEHEAKERAGGPAGGAGK